MEIEQSNPVHDIRGRDSFYLSSAWLMLTSTRVTHCVFTYRFDHYIESYATSAVKKVASVFRANLNLSCTCINVLFIRLLNIIATSAMGFYIVSSDY